MPFLERDGGWRMHFEWAGNPSAGTTLVLSHSLGSTKEMWAAQVAEWGEHFRILLYDHRGHGKSEKPAGDWTIDDFGNDLLALLDHLEQGRVCFCGVSLGGMVGMWLAQRAPGRLDRMAVANTSAFTQDPTLLRGRMRLIESEGLEAIADDVLGRWFTEKFAKQHPEVIAQFRERLLATPAESYVKTSGAICDLDLRNGLPSIQAPTLVITGKDDSATPPAWGASITEAIPGAVREELLAAHLSNVEAASEFNRVVGEFFGVG